MSAYSDWKCGAIDEQERDYYMEKEDRADREAWERKEYLLAKQEYEEQERATNGIYCENCKFYLLNADKGEYICTCVDSDLCGEEVDEQDWCGEFDGK